MARRCAFCGGTGVTLEDALAKWLSKVVVPQGQRAYITVEDQGAGQSAHRQWESLGLDRKVKQVCGTCNNGWMSDVEAVAQPWLTAMIRGLAVPLTPQVQRIVATWAVKTTLMLQYTHPAPQHLYRATRRWLFTKHEPPANAWVGLAAYAGVRPIRFVSRDFSIDRPAILPNQRDAYLLTISIYNLALQVWVWADPPEEGLSVPLPIHTDKFVIEIWPRSTETQIWPPVAFLNDAGFESFAGAFLDTPPSTPDHGVPMSRG